MQSVLCPVSPNITQNNKKPLVMNRKVRECPVYSSIEFPVFTAKMPLGAGEMTRSEDPGLNHHPVIDGYSSCSTAAGPHPFLASKVTVSMKYTNMHERTQCIS